MFTLFIIIIISIMYVPYAIKRIKAENETRSTAIQNNNKSYYDNYGVCRDTATKQQLTHKTINGDKCLIYSNGKIHTNLSEERKKDAENLRMRLNQENYERAKQLNKKGFRYLPRKNSKEDVNKGNYYMIMFDTGQIYKYDRYFWSYNKITKKWDAMNIPINLTYKYI